MELLETLILTVGPALAKTILRSWLKDSELAVNVSSSLLDILSAKTQDRIAQNRGVRQFEEIGEKVAESFLPLFEEAHLEAESKTAVIHAIAETLNEISIDPVLLIKRDLDPHELATYLMDFGRHRIRHFTAAETELYERVMTEASSDVIDMASQLPRFTERTIAEILKREGQLIAVTNQILEEVRRIREESRHLNQESAAKRFEEDYRRAIIRKLDELELFGVDISSVSRRHRLSVAYVTLSVDIQGSQEDEGQAGELTPLAQATEDNASRNIISVDEALAKSRCIVIRGPAGSGKTTLLKWIAVQAASSGFGNNLRQWNNAIPLLISLRQCVESGLPAPENFPALIVPAIAGTMPAGWVHTQLRSGRAVVLVDGVDEVPKLKRSDVRTWLKELMGTYHQTRFVVSSRPHAIEKDWMAEEGFEDAELQPMSLHDIDLFIDHWHQAVKEGLQDREEIDVLNGLAVHVKQVLRQSRSLRNLATSPLLCAMICALHRDRRTQLPSDRIELYDACIHMLLERRDIERQVDLRDYPQLTYRQKRILLEDFAYWMIINGYTTVASKSATSRFSWKLQHMVGLKETAAEDVLRLLLDRTGIIQEPLDGYINFTHRTFQEFLAAQAAIDEGDIGVLVNKADDDQWREVLIAAAGLAGNKDDRRRLIIDLIQRGDNEKIHRYKLHLLAVACLETIAELEPDVQQLVEERLADLVPPSTMTDAKALAAAGELAVPYLGNSEKEKSNIAACCVRALSTIGGEAALLALENYRADYRRTVIREIIAARDNFDVQAFDSRILPYLKLQGKDLREANLSGTDLSGINLSRFRAFSAAIVNTDLRRANLQDANLKKSDLSGADLSGADLSRADLSEAKLLGTNLSGANLCGAKLIKSSLHGADLSRADLRDADLTDADLSEIPIEMWVFDDDRFSFDWGLYKSILTREKYWAGQTHVIGADLSSTNLMGAKLNGIKLHGAKYNNNTKLPPGFDMFAADARLIV